MGKEARENKEIQEVGKYNVRIILLFMGAEGDMMQEVVDARTWMHAGLFLALNLFDGTLRCVCLNQYHGFSVSAIPPHDLESMN